MTAALALAETDRLLTFEEFAALDLDTPADLIEGRIVELSRNNPTHSHLVAELTGLLAPHVRAKGLGLVYSGDVAIITKRNPDSGRGADLAFASHDRLRDQPKNCAALEIAPELIVEVISPSNAWNGVMEKLTEYFANGVDQVWIVTPATQTIHVYTSTTNVTGYSVAERPELAAGSVLPGFTLDLREVFESA